MKDGGYIELGRLDPTDKWCRRFVLWVGIPLLICFLLGVPKSVFGQELPRFVRVEVSETQTITVRVFEKSCYGNWKASFADLDQPDWPAVYLCGHPQNLTHELAHWKHMRHTAWAGRIDERVWCATVLAPGYGTVYRVGDTICMTRDTQFEWIERRGERE